MKISDIQRGSSTAVQVKPAAASDFGALGPLDEVEIYSSELASEALLRAGQDSWAIEGTDPRQRRLLGNLLLRGLPKAVWVAGRIPRDAARPATSVLLEVREFPSELIWPEPVDFGVDEKIVEIVRKKRKSLAAIGDVVAWLTAQVLVTDAGASSRVLLSGSPIPKADQQSGFRLHGRAIAIDVDRDEEGRLLVTRVVEARPIQNDDERRPVLLVRGQFRFVDHTVSGLFRGRAQSELDQIVSGAASYLESPQTRVGRGGASWMPPQQRNSIEMSAPCEWKP